MATVLPDLSDRSGCRNKRGAHDARTALRCNAPGGSVFAIGQCAGRNRAMMGIIKRVVSDAGTLRTYWQAARVTKVSSLQSPSLRL